MEMYHFNPIVPSESLILSEEHIVSKGTCQYLKSFQIEAIQFLFSHYQKNEPCILNDESGLGKTASVASFLGATFPSGVKKKILIVVNDDSYGLRWQFHLDVLGNVPSKIVGSNFDLYSGHIFIMNWMCFLLSLYKITESTFDYIVIDGRQNMMSNPHFSNIFKRHLKCKISLVVLTQDVTVNIAELHALLKILGKLGSDKASFKEFENKFTVAKISPLDSQVERNLLEIYFTKRDRLLKFCRAFRLRRYLHDYNEKFPLVEKNLYENMLEKWQLLTNNSAPTPSMASGDEETEELLRVYIDFNLPHTNTHDSSSEREMSPLIYLDSDSNDVCELPLHQKTSEIVSESQPKTSETNQQTSSEIVNESQSKTPTNETNRQSKRVREINNLSINCKSKVIKPKNLKRGNRTVRATRAAVQNRKCRKFDGDLEEVIKRKHQRRRLDKKPKTSYKKVKLPINKDSNEEVDQNGQRLSENLVPFNELLTNRLRSKSSSVSLSLGLDGTPISSTADVAIVKPSQDGEVILLSSSTYYTSSNENPRRKKIPRLRTTPRNVRNSKVSNKNVKRNTPSPDLFSTCEDNNVEPRFDGFKIFGSEVNVASTTINSCLELLEKQQEKEEQCNKSSPKKPITGDKDDDLFEITRNNAFGNILQVNENDEVASLNNKSNNTRKNKITKYLIGTQTDSSTDTEISTTRTPKTQKTKQIINRKSPKSLMSSGKSTSTIVSNNLTKWLIKGTRSEDDDRCSIGTSKRRLNL